MLISRGHDPRSLSPFSHAPYDNSQLCARLSERTGLCPWLLMLRTQTLLPRRCRSSHATLTGHRRTSSPGWSGSSGTGRCPAAVCHNCSAEPSAGLRQGDKSLTVLCVAVLPFRHTRHNSNTLSTNDAEGSRMGEREEPLPCHHDANHQNSLPQKPAPRSYLKSLLKFLIVRLFTCVCTTAHVWRSKVNL